MNSVPYMTVEPLHLQNEHYRFGQRIQLEMAISWCSPKIGKKTNYSEPRRSKGLLQRFSSKKSIMEAVLKTLPCQLALLTRFIDQRAHTEESTNPVGSKVVLLLCEPHSISMGVLELTSTFFHCPTLCWPRIRTNWTLVAESTILVLKVEHPKFVRFHLGQATPWFSGPTTFRCREPIAHVRQMTAARNPLQNR